MKTSKLLFTFFLILLLFQGCDNESISELVVDDNATQTKIRIDLVDVAEIPRIVGDISAVSNKKSVTWSSTSKGDSKLYIDDTRVLAVTDSLGNVTYSFRLFSESFAPTDMYNLIAAKRVSGDDVEPYVIKYSFNSFEDRIAYVSSNERKFVGKMSVYQLVDFFDGYDVASKNGNPTPCPDFKDVDVNSENSSQGNSGSGTSGSGGAGSGGGTAGSSGGTSSSTIWSWVDYPPGSSYCGCSVEVGVGSFGTYGTDGSIEKSGRLLSGKGDGDCPEDDMLIPINAQIEFLCGTNNFKQIGDSYQANIGGLGVRFAEVHSDGTIIDRNIFIKNSCIGVPAHWTTKQYLNVYFPSIYNAAVVELQALMLTTGTYWSDTTIKNTLLGLISTNINAHFQDAYELGNNGVGYAAPEDLPFFVQRLN